MPVNSVNFYALFLLLVCLFVSCQCQKESLSSSYYNNKVSEEFLIVDSLLLQSVENPNSGANSSEETGDNEEIPVVFFGPPSEGFIHAMVAALSVVVVSEIGDKTFFIAVILSMKHSRIVVFSGALSALILMTVLSAGLGHISTVIPRLVVHYVSVALFVLFGLKMLKEGYSMASNDRTEYDEVQKTIQNKEDKFVTDDISSLENGSKFLKMRRIHLAIALLFAESFTMTFLAEWGDRSQLTTIILGARENVYGVIFGAVAGHAACTLLAVLGGRMVADRISVRTVTLLGGVVFLLFAVWALILGPGEDNITNNTFITVVQT